MVLKYQFAQIVLNAVLIIVLGLREYMLSGVGLGYA